MSNQISVRMMVRDDLPAIASVVDQTGLFPSDFLGAMADPFLTGAQPHHWLVAVLDNRVCGFAYCEPERATDGTFNLLAIAVEPDLQGSGIGSALINMLEQQLRALAARVLIVETSALDEFAPTWAFYAARGFDEEARIRHFYSEGEHKIVFWKHL